MREYTLRDVITNPLDPRLKGAIGKKVFCGKEVSNLLKNANSDECGETLTQIEDVDFEPFTTKDEYGDPSDWNCIILKKEEPKPKYVPFESMEEFIRKYREVMEGAEFDSFEDNLLQCGMWLRDADADTDESTYRLVYEIRGKGVRVHYYGFLDWENLLYITGLTFLDGSPCGKEASE